MLKYGKWHKYQAPDFAHLGYEDENAVGKCLQEDLCVVSMKDSWCLARREWSHWPWEWVFEWLKWIMNHYCTNKAGMQPKEKAAETWHANWYNFYPLVERPNRWVFNLFDTTVSSQWIYSDLYTGPKIQLSLQQVWLSPSSLAVTFLLQNRLFYHRHHLSYRLPHLMSPRL